MLFFRFIGAALVAAAPAVDAFTNPIRNPGGADPQISFFDGWYYLISTEWTDLKLARAQSIEGLKTAEPKVIYVDADPSHCCSVWAPEIHLLNGTWYLYYTAGTSDNLDGQRLHVLSGGASPWDDWTYSGRMIDHWGIDGTILRFTDWGNYFVYSCMTGVPHQSTCIRKLGDDNISLTGPLSIISQPDEPWEQSEVPVHEGAFGLYFGGRTYIAYSANFCWTPDYCVALLEWDGLTDPMVPTAWTKSDGCVLTSGEGNFGTGHNSFFRSPDGTETWITFHATDFQTGACDDRRYTMVQPLTANADGTPNFGSVQNWQYEWNEPSA